MHWLAPRPVVKRPPLPPPRARRYIPCRRRGLAIYGGDRMSDAKDWPLNSFIEAAAAALALPIEPAWKPQIEAHLQVTWRLAQEVAEFELPDELEPAPVFET